MENISKLPAKTDRDIFYYRQRYKNRVHEALTSFFAEEAERRGITKQDVAESIQRDPAQITRWLNAPSNLTLDTISDLLLSLDAEMDSFVARFEDRGKPNEIHPLIADIVGGPPPKIIRANKKNAVPAESRTGVKVENFGLEPAE